MCVWLLFVLVCCCLFVVWLGFGVFWVVVLFCFCFLGGTVLFLTFPEHWQNQERIEFTDA